MDLVSFYGQHVQEEVTDFRFIGLKEFLVSHFQDRSVADIGCGTGALILELSRDGYEVAGFEPTPELFALARDLQLRSRLEYPLFNLGVDQMTASMFSSFRNFILIDVLEHLENDREAARKICSLMPPGAQLLCLVPAFPALYGKRDRAVGHFRRYSRRAIRELFAACAFREVEVLHWNAVGVPAYWFFEKVLHTTVPEGFRLHRTTGFRRALNRLLLLWFRSVENRVSLPFGLSMLVRAVK